MYWRALSVATDAEVRGRPSVPEPIFATVSGKGSSFAYSRTSRWSAGCGGHSSPAATRRIARNWRCNHFSCDCFQCRVGQYPECRQICPPADRPGRKRCRTSGVNAQRVSQNRHATADNSGQTWALSLHFLKAPSSSAILKCCSLLRVAFAGFSPTAKLLLIALFVQFSCAVASGQGMYSFTVPTKEEMGLAGPDYEGCCPSVHYPKTTPDLAAKHRIPNLIGIGVQKSGTRYMYDMLRCHPAFAVNKKELHFFDKNATTQEDYEEYLKKFNGFQKSYKARFEFTPIYFLVSTPSKHSQLKMPTSVLASVSVLQIVPLRLKIRLCILLTEQHLVALINLTNAVDI